MPRQRDSETMNAFDREGNGDDLDQCELERIALGGRSMSRTITGYMCKTDFDFELGSYRGGVEVYESIQDLARCRRCVTECGIVEVEIRVVRCWRA